MNIRTTLIDGDDPMEMEEALTEETQLLVLESPSSVVFHVQDIERAAEAAHKKGALVYIDNTFCTADLPESNRDGSRFCDAYSF